MICPIDQNGQCLFCKRDKNSMVPGYGKNQSLCIVGEAPGTIEVQKKRPFVGESGQLLRRTLLAAGINPEDVYMTNAYLCKPTKGGAPDVSSWVGCRPRLLEELAHAEPKKLLLVGATSTSSVLGLSKTLAISKIHGRGMMINLNGSQVYTVPTYHPAAVLRDLDLFRDVAEDLMKWKEHDTPLPPIEYSLFIPTTGPECFEALDELSQASVISCDIETTGFLPLTDKVLTIGFGAALQDGTFYTVIIPMSLIYSKVVQLGLIDFFRKFSGIFVLHNAKFDLQFLQVLLNFPMNLSRVIDSMLMHYALDERPGGQAEGSAGRRSYLSHGLRDLSRIRYDAPDYKTEFNYEEFLKNLTPQIEQMPLSELWSNLYHYQSLDLCYTYKLFGDLKKEILEESEKLAYLVEEVLMPAVNVIKDIELHGVLIDRPYFENLKISILSSLEKDLENLQIRAREIGDLKTFNPLSPLQVSYLIYEKLKIRPPQGVRTTERDVLKSILRKIPDNAREFIQAVLDYRQKARVLQTYVDGLLKRADSEGRVRSDFLLHGTITGRLSSQDPNLQNQPILMGKEIRDGFIAPQRFKLVEADYSQLELRVAAWYSGDPDLIRTFKEGRDVHRAVAAKMFRKPEDEITDHERYLAKYVDFGVLYGRGAKSLTEGWEMDYLEQNLGGTRWTLKEAERFLQEFLNGFPKLKQWIREQHTRVLTQRFVETPFGNRRRFPFIPESDRSTVERQSVNTPIQGMASHICLTSMTRLHWKLPVGAYVLFPVHDAIMFEIRDDLLPDTLRLIKNEMETPHEVLGATDIPFKVELKVGERWGSLEKVEVT